MLGNITGWHALILLAVILLLFGATRLPALARSVGQSARIFRSETAKAKDPGSDEPGATSSSLLASAPGSVAGAPAPATVVTDGANDNR